MFDASLDADVPPLEQAPRLRWVTQVGEPTQTCSLLPKLSAHPRAIVCAHAERWHVLDPDDGRVRFAIMARHPIPHVQDDVVLAVEERASNTVSKVVARDVESGEVLWSQMFEGDVWFSAGRLLVCRDGTLLAFALDEPRRPPDGSPVWSATVLPEAYVSAVTLQRALTETFYQADEGYVSSWAHLRAFDIATGVSWPAWSVDPDRAIRNLVADELGMAFETDEFEAGSSSIDPVVKLFDRAGLRWSRANAQLVGLGRGVVVVTEPARPFDAGRLVALDRASGALSAELGSVRRATGRPLLHPPAIALARDITYWGALSASRRDGTELWRTSLDEVPGGAIYSMAALPRRVYGLTNGWVFCLEGDE